MPPWCFQSSYCLCKWIRPDCNSPSFSSCLNFEEELHVVKRRLYETFFSTYGDSASQRVIHPVVPTAVHVSAKDKCEGSLYCHYYTFLSLIGAAAAVAAAAAAEGE
jgi:hypothetical protein